VKNSDIGSQAAPGAASYRPQYEIVAEKIVELIHTAEMKPGDRLPTEQRLGEQLGVSRSVVREAVKSLTATGLVVARKGVGISVAGQSPSMSTAGIHFSMTVDPEHIQALFDFRCLQDMLVARLATEHITVTELRELEKHLTLNRSHAAAGDCDAFLKSDDAFHLAIAHATHNPFLVETISSILSLQRWAIKIMTGGAPGSLQTSFEEHEAIFNAIKSGQMDEAVQAAKVHVESVQVAYRQEVRRRLLVNDSDEQRRKI
jgi:GntR family transcriptional repressor for pyruvate dehydrogenase complex